MANATKLLQNRAYLQSSTTLLLFFASWGIWWSFFQIWLTNKDTGLGLNGEQVGTVYSANSFVSRVTCGVPLIVSIAMGALCAATLDSCQMFRVRSVSRLPSLLEAEVSRPEPLERATIRTPHGLSEAAELRSLQFSCASRTVSHPSLSASQSSAEPVRPRSAEISVRAAVLRR